MANFSVDFSVTTPPPSGDASITLTAARNTVPIAPEHITVRVTDWVNFDIPAPPAGQAYDRRLHEIDYYWTIRDAEDSPPPDWTMPTRVIGSGAHASNKSGVGFTAMIQAVLPAGVWTFTCVATDPATGTTATASYEATIADPLTWYPTNRIIAIDGTASPDWAGAPAGAHQATSIAEAESIRNAQGVPQRFDPYMFLLRRGATYELDTPWQPWNNHHYFGTFGEGTRPIITESASWSNPLDLGLLDRRGETGADLFGGTGVDNRVVGLHFKSDWDPVTETAVHRTQGYHSIASNSAGATNTVFDDCMFDNCALAVSGNMHSIGFNNCSWTDWQSMGMFLGSQANLPRMDIAILGCSGKMNPDASGGGPKFSDPFYYNEHGPFRLSLVERVYVRGCDFFNNVGWSSPFPQTMPQNSMRIFTHGGSASRGNAFACVVQNVCEGGYQPIEMFEGTGVDALGGINAIIAMNAVLGTYRTNGMFATKYPGCSVYNNVLVIPDTAALDENIGRFLTHIVRGTDQPRLSNWDGAENWVYNNTAIMPDGFATMQVNSAGEVDVTVNEHNNILQLTTPTGAWPDMGPFDTSEVMFAPIMNGTRWVSNYHQAALDAGYAFVAEDSTRATPSDTMKAYKPTTGSPALGSATTGRVAYRDFYGNVRPSTKDKGAFQVSS